MDSLGNTLVNFFRIIPDGVLVFFPSYVVMETLFTHWKEHSNIFMRMEQHKQIFEEPKFKNEFNSVMSAYYEKIGSADKVGGAFFGVCRGKVSEGLDFADNNGRAVIITGLPYPPFAEPKVQLKMEYLKDARSNFNRTELITDKQWYNQQATRAVNQAIGRVIRHKNDYGAIILCDERFTYSRGQDDLPLWLRPQLQKYDKFGPAQRDLTSFFKTAQNKYGHLVSIKNSLPDIKRDYTSGIVGGARGVVKLNPDAIFKDDDEIEDIDIEDYTTPSLSNNEIESRCDLLSSLKFDELHPVQPHHVAMAASRKREEGKRDDNPQTSQ
uniref:Regulator of telomere elongation helicase 1 homolog n=1 Tax=Amphimedon queenslandica TaxID=400682 RepID=A0A1X7SPS6_AMPQE